MTPLAKASTAIDELVAANHILFDQGVVDGFGHVSIRHGQAGDRFLLARSIAPALATDMARTVGPPDGASSTDSDPAQGDHRATNSVGLFRPVYPSP